MTADIVAWLRLKEEEWRGAARAFEADATTPKLAEPMHAGAERFRAAADALERAEKTIAALTAQRDDARAALERVTGERDAAQADAEHADEHIAECQAALRFHGEEPGPDGAVDYGINRLADRLIDASQRARAAEADRDRLREELAGKEEERRATAEMLREAIEKREACRAECNRVDAAWHEMRRLRNDMEADRDRLAAELKECQRQLGEVGHSLNQSNEECDRLAAEVERARKAMRQILDIPEGPRAGCLPLYTVRDAARAFLERKESGDGK